MLKLNFKGDLSFLSSMAEVITLDTYNHYAEVHLKDEVEPSDFLKKITDKIDITHFSVIEPTLNRIFIDLIKQN